MLAQVQKLNLTVGELETLLTGRTDNGEIDTIPEMIDAVNESSQSARPFNPDSPMIPMGEEELNTILI